MPLLTHVLQLLNYLPDAADVPAATLPGQHVVLSNVTPRRYRSPSVPMTYMTASLTGQWMHRFCMVPLPGHSHVSEIVLAKVVNSARRFR